MSKFGYNRLVQIPALEEVGNFPLAAGLAEGARKGEDDVLQTLQKVCKQDAKKTDFIQIAGASYTILQANVDRMYAKGADGGGIIATTRGNDLALVFLDETRTQDLAAPGVDDIVKDLWKVVDVKGKSESRT